MNPFLDLGHVSQKISISLASNGDQKPDFKATLTPDQPNFQTI